MRPEIKQILLELPKTSHGQALKVFLDEQFKEINDVTGITTLEEAKGKQYALKVLKKIFSFYGEHPVGDKKPNQYT